MPSILLSGDSGEDPITQALQPPPDETPEARQERLRLEKEAKQRSDEIDAQLKQDSKALARGRQLVRVLLLGQSESGKSTTLKNFQKVWAPQAWKEERESWRSVVLLNIIKSAFIMVSVLITPTIPPTGEILEENVQGYISEETLQVNVEALFNDLVAAEAIIRRQLCGSAEAIGDYRTKSGGLPNLGNELFIPSNVSWKDRLTILGGKGRKSLNGVRPSNDSSRPNTPRNEQDKATEILIGRKRDIQKLWNSDSIQDSLRMRGIKLEQTPGFFLNDLDRILSLSYDVSDDDVVRARLRTMGVQEHNFRLEFDSSSSDIGKDWVIYDVGGSRPQVSIWFSFFDDVNAIIFIVPVNCFDEALEEDENMNRLQDSITLWKEICRSKLFADAQIILFLNKVDLLKHKLESGIHFASFVPSYGDRPNEVTTVCRFLKNQFKEVHQKYSPKEREFNAWTTCATDIKATTKTIQVVRHGIVQNILKKATLI
ncbi:hypothetical protein M422DRAFT_219501 [Sphaerobolus stellatus SS14]|nr:hypothetical protein M422DRAFT_219501 [Sphaerobolus stellatus SS14]